jgi:hypothetical protein
MPEKSEAKQFQQAEQHSHDISDIDSISDEKIDPISDDRASPIGYIGTLQSSRSDVRSYMLDQFPEASPI